MSILPDTMNRIIRRSDTPDTETWKAAILYDRQRDKLTEALFACLPSTEHARAHAVLNARWARHVHTFEMADAKAAYLRDLEDFQVAAQLGFTPDKWLPLLLWRNDTLREARP